MDADTGDTRPDRRLLNRGPRAAAAAALTAVALAGAVGLTGTPAGAAPGGAGQRAAITATGDPVDPAATAQIVVGTVLHFRTVPVGYAATVVGLVQRPLGTAVTATLQRQHGTGWVTVATKALPASTTSVKTHATFPVSTAASGRRTFRVVVTPDAGGPSATGPERTMTVVVPRITAVHPPGDEYVVLKNAGATAFDVRRWTLGTATLFITLPHRVLRPGESVRVYTGPGTSTPNRLYVSRLGNLWHPHGTALLNSPDHVLLASRTF